MILETQRLILRPFEDSDAESVFEYAKDPDVGPIAGWPPHTSVENSLDIIRNVLAVSETYAICLKPDTRAIGAVGLMLGDSSNLGLKAGEGEIGFWLGKPFWGQGIMPEAVRELIRHAFVELKLDTLWCGYFDGNGKSRRAQEKCGFVYHHTNRDIHWKLMDDIRTEHITRLTRDEWKDSFSVRSLTGDEVPDALELAWKVFSEYEAPEYAPEGTEEFRRCLHDSAYLSGIEYYGAFDGVRLAGVLGIRRSLCHICFFFVDGKYHRSGIGTKLFSYARKEYPGSITLNSSPYGVPFYLSLGFTPVDSEQTVNGIRFTPMIFKNGNPVQRIVKLSERRDLMDKAAGWFSSKWSVPKEAYLESIEQSFSADAVPSWYLCMEGERIIGGLGVIENDFHNRKDLTPNVCAVYTESSFRHQGVAGRLLNFVCQDMKEHGIGTLYLLTELEGFYERYGWTYLCPVQGDGEDYFSRMYRHEL